VQLTNPRETAAFFVARAVVVAIHFVMTPVLLTPLYRRLLHAGGVMLMDVAASSVSFVTWLVTLLLFLAARGGFGGVPLIVAREGRRDAVTSSVGEVVAYLAAVLIVMVVEWLLSASVLAGVYASLRQSGHTILIVLISLAVSAAAAVAAFLIFIAMRGATPGAKIADEFD
jgi:hypothetical protein